jgi:hypothetical protein
MHPYGAQRGGVAGPVLSAWELLKGEAIPRMSTVVRRYVAHSQAQLDRRTLTAYKGGRPWQAALSDIWRLHGEILVDLRRA